GRHRVGQLPRRVIAHLELAAAEPCRYRAARAAPEGGTRVATRELHHHLAGTERSEEDEQCGRAGPQQSRQAACAVAQIVDAVERREVGEHAVEAWLPRRLALHGPPLERLRGDDA